MRRLKAVVTAIFVPVLAAGALFPAVAAPRPGEQASVLPARQICDAEGGCFETGDPGYRDDDDRPSPRRRYSDPGDDDRPTPPPRRFDPDDDDRSSPPRRRFDPDNDDRAPPHRRYDRDDD